MEKVSDNECVFTLVEKRNKVLQIEMFDGTIVTFKHYDASFIEAMRTQSSELKIKAMALDVARMEEFVQQKRTSLAKELKSLLSDKKCRDRVEGEIIVWKEWLKDCYESINLDQPITPYQLVKKVQTGVFSIRFSEEIIETLTSEISNKP